MGKIRKRKDEHLFNLCQTKEYFLHFFYLCKNKWNFSYFKIIILGLKDITLPVCVDKARSMR